LGLPVQPGNNALNSAIEKSGVSETERNTDVKIMI